MMNKELVELQKGCGATCVIIANEDVKELDSKVLVSSNCGESELRKIFKEKMTKLNQEFNYFVIEEIDKLEIEEQDKFYHIVKDREFYGSVLPEDVIIVLTVKNKDGLKNVLQKLYHLCVVAF